MLAKSKTKGLILKALFAAGLLLITASSMACEIHMNVAEKNQKEKYDIGDELVIEVEIVLEHRNCDVAIEDTKFTSSGCKIMGATPWKQTNPNTYTRKLKVTVTKDIKEDIMVVCKRSCHKDGGLAKLTLNRN